MISVWIMLPRFYSHFPGFILDYPAKRNKDHFHLTVSSTQGLTHTFKQGQALFEIRVDVIHSKCINKTNFMSGIDVYMYDWPHSNII